MVLFVREASGARNLEALIPLAARFGPHRIALCTDDRDPDHIAVRRPRQRPGPGCGANGVDPLDALVMASLTAATWHGLDDRGAIAAGRRADLLLLPDLERFVPDEVLVAGRRPDWPGRLPVPAWTLNTGADRRPGGGRARRPAPEGDARVIELIPGQILTAEMHERLPSPEAMRSPTRPATSRSWRSSSGTWARGRVGLGFVRGFGLLRGAIASSVAHDAHNLSLRAWTTRTCWQRCGGWRSWAAAWSPWPAARCWPSCRCPSPGSLSDAPVADVLRQTGALTAAARSLGCEFEGGPFHSLSFLALSVIPALKLTDQGLVDVDRFQIVPLGVKAGR